MSGREFLEFCAAARGLDGLGDGQVLAQRFEADLARHTVIDMELTEPTLEEIFLTFYGHRSAQ